MAALYLLLDENGIVESEVIISTVKTFFLFFLVIIWFFKKLTSIVPKLGKTNKEKKILKMTLQPFTWKKNVISSEKHISRIEEEHF